jgi:hypothetical protein
VLEELAVEPLLGLPPQAVQKTVSAMISANPFTYRLLVGVQCFTVIATESTAFFPETPSSVARMPR